MYITRFNVEVGLCKSLAIANYPIQSNVFIFPISNVCIVIFDTYSKIVKNLY